VVQSWGLGAGLIERDRELQRAENRKLALSFEMADALGAPAVLVGSGSRNPRGRYWPHPENGTAEVEATLVANLRERADAAATAGLQLCLECHCLTTLDTPERIARVFAAVDHPALKLNLDPVNLVADLPTLWDSSGLLDRVFSLMAPHAISGHVKDVYAEDRLVLHLSETLISDGVFDVVGFMDRFERRLPEAYMFLEHLPAELVGRGKDALDRLLERCNIDPR
jgi:sugar phosphate isomerase/epimerase